jgi:hypothetical protein
MHPTLSDDPIPGGSVHVIGIGRVAWSRVIPFRIDANNMLTPITTASWRSPDGESRSIELPLTARFPKTEHRFEPP